MNDDSNSDIMSMQWNVLEMKNVWWIGWVIATRVWVSIFKAFLLEFFSKSSSLKYKNMKLYKLV